MATFTKFNSFVEAMAEKAHNLGADTLKLLLSNAAPVATNTVKANLTEITPGNGYSAGGPSLSNVTSAQTSGTYKLNADDVVITASGGSIGPFRYIALYNDTAASDELIAWWDYGAALTLAAGESLTVDFSASNGILQLA